MPVGDGVPDPAGHRADRRRHRRVSGAGADAGRCSTSPTASSSMAERRRAGRGSSPAVQRHRGPGLRRRGRVALARPSRRASACGSIVDDRQGFAYAGTLDDDVARRGAGRGPRQRRASASPTSATAWPSPTASTPPTSTCGRDGLAAVATDDKVDAGPRARAGRARPPTRASAASSRPSTATRIGEAARRHHHRHPRRRRASRPATSSAYALAERGRRDPDRLRLLGRPRARPTSTSTRPPADAVRPGHPAARRHQARRRERLTVVLDPCVTAQLLGIVGGTLVGEAVLKGRSLFADRVGEAGRRRRCSRSSTTPPTRRPYGAPTPRRRGPGHPPQRADRRRRAAAASCTTPTPARRLGHGVHRLGGARRLQVDARRRAAGPWRCAPGTAVARPSCSPASATACSCTSVAGLHSGVNPVSGDFSVGAEGLRITRRRAGRAGPRGHHRLDPPAHAARRRRRSAPTSSGCR